MSLRKRRAVEKRGVARLEQLVIVAPGGTLLPGALCVVLLRADKPVLLQQNVLHDNIMSIIHDYIDVAG